VPDREVPEAAVSSVDPSVDRITELVAGQTGTLAGAAGKDRTAALMRLVLRHWPHEHLRTIAREGGKNHADLIHVGKLLKSQVREQYEARHGVSPTWGVVLAPLLDAIWLVVVESWFRDPDFRVTLRVVSKKIAEREA
jgi:LmbE family N-acetylglucosaminyl deacetylase